VRRHSRKGFAAEPFCIVCFSWDLVLFVTKNPYKDKADFAEVKGLQKIFLSEVN
jgi:hypothetical protein